VRASGDRLRVLEEAELLAAEVHAATRPFERGPDAPLCDQARRAAQSVAGNIAEGNGKRPGPDRLRMLDIARGSLRELETHLRKAHRVQLLGATELATLQVRCTHTGRLLAGFMRWCRRQL
jgi:four helix bundle protein